ncbi:hypothetical protein QQX98_001367 [Neonectria punicea]|uniref:Nephrocystin 3-like N-terminal domain-containing protein n=1 Tax=Neonectria punicea TaxID=979145 RepID=A0ABR1HQJ4_9HYPO
MSGEGQQLHPALSEHHDPDPCTFEPFFDWVFFVDQRFEYWQRDENKWVLRCFGRPGTGKTTLSSMIVKKLRDKYTNNRDAVASIFVKSDVLFNGSFFVEDVMVSIFRQLCTRRTQVEEAATYIEKYKAYLEARKLQHRDVARISLIREALELRIQTLDHKFFVLDDFDKCNPSVDLFLENEISRLKNLGLKTCEDVPFELCQSCKDNGRGCGNCGDDARFEQPYDYVDLDISPERFGQHYMEQFVDWKLESEHGELPLRNPSNNPRKPPHSAIGASLAVPRNGAALDALRREVLDRAKNNIVLARIRIDMLQDNRMLERLGSMANRLPGAVVALFDAAMKRIERQPEGQRDLGLTAITVISHASFNRGVPFATFQRILEKAAMTSEQRYPSHRSIEEVLHAAKGFIVVEPLQHRPLKAYTKDFHLYTSENYNENLAWVRSQVQVE